MIEKMNEKFKIQRDKVLSIYKNSSPEQKILLENLFGSEVFKTADVRECIKTFADAAKAVGIADPEEWEKNYSGVEPDILAYFKLRIIIQALNEGWKPQFTEDEWRYYPWFYLCTKEEIDYMDNNEKKRRNLQLRKVGDYAGFGSSISFNVPSNTNASIGSRLCLKNRELASYCGTQFTDIWIDFVIGQDYIR